MLNSRCLIAFLFIFLLKIAPAQRDSLLRVNLSIQHVVCTDGAAAVEISGGKQPYEIKWSNGANNISYIKDLKEGDYHVQVSDSDTLKQDTTIYFTIQKFQCPVIIPNHFTPNGDDYNDTWKIINIENYPEFELFVYNKWGQQVFHQKNSYTPWDGTWLGLKAADGTYYYVFYFKASEKDKFLKGDVSILR